MSSVYEWCVIECESVMVDKILMYMEKSIGPGTELRGISRCTGAIVDQ